MRLSVPKSRSGRFGEEKNLAPAGNQTPAVQPVARRYTDWAIPALCEIVTILAGSCCLHLQDRSWRRYNLEDSNLYSHHTQFWQYLLFPRTETVPRIRFLYFHISCSVYFYALYVYRTKCYWPSFWTNFNEYRSTDFIIQYIIRQWNVSMSLLKCWCNAIKNNDEVPWFIFRYHVTDKLGFSVD
jgi:hypothetical protein